MQFVFLNYYFLCDEGRLKVLKFPLISPPDLYLVEFSDKHLTANYVAWLNDPEVVQFSEQRHKHHSMSSCREYFLAKKESLSDLFLAIEIERDGHLHHVGNMGVSLDLHNEVADISIMVGDKEFWGQGIGTRAWCLLLDSLLRMKGIRLVTAGTMSVNNSMLKLIEKSGMAVDAVLKKRFLCDEKVVDLIVASKSKK